MSSKQTSFWAKITGSQIQGLLFHNLVVDNNQKMHKFMTDMMRKFQLFLQATQEADKGDSFHSL